MSNEWCYKHWCIFPGILLLRVTFEVTKIYQTLLTVQNSFYRDRQGIFIRKNYGNFSGCYSTLPRIHHSTLRCRNRPIVGKVKIFKIETLYNLVSSTSFLTGNNHFKDYIPSNIKVIRLTFFDDINIKTSCIMLIRFCRWILINIY